MPAKMKLSKKIAWMRSVIFGYVVILSLSCLGQIGLGSVLLWDHVSFNELVENSFWKPAAMLIGEAIIGLLICWLGWNSTRKKNRCNLGLFSTLLLMSCFMHLYVAYWAHELRSVLLKTGSERFEFSLDITFDKFFHNHKYEPNHIWNRIQEEYQCCGVDGPSNYRQGSAIPWSCFARAGDATAAFDPKSTNFATSAALKINQIGCLEVLSNLMRRHLLFGALGSLCSAILQCLGSFCTLQLIMLLGRKQPTAPDPFKTATLRRHKLDHDLQKPLAERRRALDSQSPDTSSNPKSPAFGGENSAHAYM